MPSMPNTSAFTQTRASVHIDSFFQVFESFTQKNLQVPPGMVGWDMRATQLYVDEVTIGGMGNFAAENLTEMLANRPFWGAVAMIMNLHSRTRQS